MVNLNLIPIFLLKAIFHDWKKGVRKEEDFGLTRKFFDINDRPNMDQISQIK